MPFLNKDFVTKHKFTVASTIYLLNAVLPFYSLLFLGILGFFNLFGDIYPNIILGILIIGLVPLLFIFVKISDELILFVPFLFVFHGSLSCFILGVLLIFVKPDGQNLMLLWVISPCIGLLQLFIGYYLDKSNGNSRKQSFETS